MPNTEQRELNIGPATLISDTLHQLEDALRSLGESINNDIASGFVFDLLSDKDSLARLHLRGAKEQGEIQPYGYESHPWLQPGLPVDQRVAAAVKQIRFVENQPPKSSLVFPGAMLCSPATIQKIKAANEAKTEFKMAVMTARNKKEGFGLDNSAVRTIFASIGYSDICLKQAYRPICYVENDQDVVIKYFIKAKTPGLKATGQSYIKRKEENMTSAEKQALDWNIVKEKLATAGDLVVLRNTTEVLTANVTLRKGVITQKTAVLPLFCSVPYSLHWAPLNEMLNNQKEHPVRSRRTIEEQHFEKHAGETIYLKKTANCRR